MAAQDEVVVDDDRHSLHSTSPERRVERLATIVLLLVPVAIYVSFVHAYGVNAIWYDQWENIALLTHSTFYFHSYVGHTDLSMLWAQHNENRMLFPNLIVLALGALANMNVLTEMYISAIMLMIALLLIVLTHHRDLGIRLFFYVPLAFLMLSLGQYGDTLFGFQVAWYLIVLSLAVVIVLLDSFRIGWFLLIAAIAVAVIGSYSSLQGLLIWPVGLVVLLWRHGKLGLVVAWVTAAVATGAIYFYNFDFTSTSGSSSYLTAHPLAVAEFFFFNIGDITGRPLSAGASNPDVVAIGVMIFLLAVVCLLIYARPGHLSKSPVGPALIVFGLLFAATVAYGRSPEGLSVASQSRYVTFNLLILGGCYLCLIEGWPSRAVTPAAASVSPGTARLGETALRFVDWPQQTYRAEWKRFVVVGLRLLVVVVIIMTVWGGVENGRAGGAGSRAQLQLAAIVAAHARVAPNSLIKADLFPNPSVPYDDIRRLAELAAAEHLSFFGTGASALATRESLPRTTYTPLLTAVRLPKEGAVLRGSVFLNASATGDYPITGLQFLISAAGGEPLQRLPATQFRYGYLGAWHTTNVSNGSYTIESIARDSAGQTRTSRPLSVTVAN